MSINVSTRLPDSALSHSAIDEAITVLTTNIASEKSHGTMPDGPTLDITFMLAGKHEKPVFSGMRMGGYTQQEKTLYFETAVPKHITRSEIAPYYVAKVLEDVIDNANVFFSDIDVGINFDADHWRRTIQKFINPENVIPGNNALIS